jgi:hypothetical protein
MGVNPSSQESGLPVALRESVFRSLPFPLKKIRCYGPAVRHFLLCL